MKDQAERKLNSTWEELPTVILSEKIKKEKWAVNTKVSTSVGKTLWSSTNFNPHTPEICISVKYKKFEIQLSVEWQTTNRNGKHLDRFKIELHSVVSQSARIRPRTSKTYHGAISKIEDIIIALLPYFDAQFEREEKSKQLTEELIRVTKNVQKELGISQLDTPYAGVLRYNEGRTFGVDININRNTHLISLSYIRGRFTIDEVRQIIQIIGTNPRAVAERLCK